MKSKLRTHYKLVVHPNNKTSLYTFHGSLAGWQLQGQYFNEGYAMQAITDSVEIERQAPYDAAKANRDRQNKPLEDIVD